MNVSEILEGAADKIERDGWFQGRYVGPFGGVCMAGGLRYALGDRNLCAPWFESDCALAIAAAIGADSPRGISVWNDEPERTAAEVIAMLRSVAAVERARAAVAVERERERESA